MKKKAKVIINEQHTLLPQQEYILNEHFGDDGWEFLKVPADGWTLKEMTRVVEKLIGNTVVFVSPIPFLIMSLSYYQGAENRGLESEDQHTNVSIFHNDKREKKELPNGKVISVTAKTGWHLI